MTCERRRQHDLTRAERIAQQRRELPDSPGVYLFHDADGEILYVGKARSIRKRVASHFSGGDDPPHLAGRPDRVPRHRRPRPRRCSPSRASSSATGRASTSVCATTSPIPTSASASTRSTRGSTSPGRSTAPGRAYFGPFSSAKRVRETLDLLGKLFQFRTCEGAEPGRRSGSPCLDYFIKRCGAPCVGYVDAGGVPSQHRRDHRLPLRSLPPGRGRRAGQDGGGGRRPGSSSAPPLLPRPPQGDPVAVRAPAGRRRLGRQRRPDRRRGRGARRQRPGLPGPRRHPRRAAELLPRQPGRARARRGRRGVHRPVLLGFAGGAADDRRRPLPARPRRGARRGAGRAARRPGRGAGRRARRQAAPARAGRAQRPPRPRPGPAAPRAPPPAPGRVAGDPARGARHGGAAGADRGLRHLQPRRRPHRRLDGRVRGGCDEEGRLPPLPGAGRAQQRLRRLRLDGRGAERGG